MPIKITRAAELGRPNTRRMNRLEELGRVDAEKAYTGKGKRNLRDEKQRIIGELGHGVQNRNRRRLYKKKGGRAKGPHGFGPKPYLNRPGQSQGTHGGRTGKAKGGHVKSMRKATRGGGAAIR